MVLNTDFDTIVGFYLDYGLTCLDVAAVARTFGFADRVQGFIGSLDDQLAYRLKSTRAVLFVLRPDGTKWLVLLPANKAYRTLGRLRSCSPHLVPDTLRELRELLTLLSL